MSAFDRYIPSDDSDVDLPPGVEADDFDAPQTTSAPDDDLDGDPFVDESALDEPLPSEKRDWEAEAKAMGWKDPKETGRGADAKSFVLGSRKEGERLLTQVDDLTRSIRDMQTDQRRAQIQARADGYRRALDAIRTERDRARSQYDVEAMDRAYQQEMQLINNARQEAQQIQMEQQQYQQQADSRPNPEWDSWVAENQWYEKDTELREMADEVGVILHKKGFTGRELMNLVAHRLRVANPEKFTNPRRRNAPVNDSNASRPAGSTNPIMSMPNEVRAAFSDFYDEHKAEFKTKAAAQKYFLDLMKG